MTKQEFIERYSEKESILDITYDLNSVIAEAIAEYEAKQWHKYPEEKPKPGEYIIQLILGDMDIDTFSTKLGDDWYMWSDDVIAWRELPSPYQPQEGDEG